MSKPDYTKLAYCTSLPSISFRLQYISIRPVYDLGHDPCSPDNCRHNTKYDLVECLDDLE